MRRRDFLTLLGGSAAAWPLAARAQQSTVPVIGALITPSPSEFASRLEEFRRGLGEAGFTEGRNVAIEYRYADNQLDRLPSLVADLVGRKVAVIFVTGDTVTALPMLKAATQTIPIVFTTGSDPVSLGMVASLNRPGGNVTGVTSITVELGPKGLELLHEIVPEAGKIGLLVNPNNGVGPDAMIRLTQAAAGRLGREVLVVGAGSAEEIGLAFATLAQQGVRALVVGQDAFFLARREQVAALALNHRMATVSFSRRQAEAGELISYGSVDDNGRQAGIYVGRILKGEKAGDLPVVQPTKFELVVNLKTAKALGITISDAFLARADEVIE
jgi:putative ABC transport system substrate-binding protein